MRFHLGALLAASTLISQHATASVIPSVDVSSALYPRTPQVDKTKQQAGTVSKRQKVYFPSGTVFRLSKTEKLKIKKPFSSGGMGVIYHGTISKSYSDGVEREEVAVKVVPFDHIRIHFSKIRDIQNRLAKRCSHVPKVIDVFNTKEEQVMVLEYINGWELFDVLDDYRTNDRTENARRILGDFKKMSDIVGCLHRERLSHGDLSSANFMMKKRSNEIILIDFDSVYDMKETRFVKEREALGRPAMPQAESPERYYFKLGEYYNARLDDIWAMGILFFEMCTGEFPWNYYEDAKDHDKEGRDFYWYAVRGKASVYLRVRKGFRRFFNKAFDKEKDRFQTVQELQEAAEALWPKLKQRSILKD